jgi:hypothetical protein
MMEIWLYILLVLCLAKSSIESGKANYAMFVMAIS